MKKLVAFLMVAALVVTAACKPETVRGVVAGIQVGAGELRGEVEAGVAAGDYTQAEADFLFPIIDELETNAEAVAARTAAYDGLTPAARRVFVLDAITHVGGSIERLSQKGIGIKSAQGRARLDKYLRQGRRAVSVLRVIEAAIPRK